jgi:HEAT repeat protein
LADRGNAESIPKLESLLKDDHASVRLMAAAAIISISGRIEGVGADRSK